MRYFFTTAVAAACLLVPQFATAGEVKYPDNKYTEMVATHARANAVPETLVHRVIVRESRYHPQLIGLGGAIGLMQIKLATARGLGYAGDADGLRDPNTNLTYGVKYLAGAYRAARGDAELTIRYFASGYYYVAKQQRLETARQHGARPGLKRNGVGAPLQLVNTTANAQAPIANRPVSNAHARMK